MFDVRGLCMALAATAAVGAAVGPAGAAARQLYDPQSIAYRYTYYADAAKTEPLGEAYDTCGGYEWNYWVLHPYIPTTYYDQTPMYVCTASGPYLPPEWPY